MVIENITKSLLVKVASVISNVLLVPITIGYLSPAAFGVWMTISSIMAWLSVMDIGLGHGLKNKVTELTVLGNRDLAREQVGGVFYVYGLITIIVVPIISILVYCISIKSALNADIASEVELKLVVFISAVSSVVLFSLRSVGLLYSALQKTWINDLCQGLGSITSLIGVFILVKFDGSRSILHLSIAYAVLPIVVYLLAGLHLFTIEAPDLLPKIKDMKLCQAKEAVQMGLKFFLLQMIGLVLFSTTTIIVAHVGNSIDVACYNVASRLISPFGQAFNIFISPLWPAFAAAQRAGDLAWIRSVIKKMRKAWLLSIPVYVGIVLASGTIYSIWIGKSLTVPFAVTAWVSVYYLANSYMGIHVSYLNGVGKLKLQITLGLVLVLGFALLSVMMSQIYGYVGVIICSSVICVIYALVMGYQVSKITDGTAGGVWNE